MNGSDAFTVTQSFEIENRNNDYKKRNNHSAGVGFSHKMGFKCF